jgi:hypothetical protein
MSTYCRLNKTAKCKIHKTGKNTCCNNKQLGQSWCWKTRTVKKNCAHMKKNMKCRVIRNKKETCCINPLKGHWCWSNNLPQHKMQKECCSQHFI